MKHCIFYVLVFVYTITNAQTYEVGIFAGGANNIGDVGRTDYIFPSNIAFGGLFKWNKSKRYAWRASVTYGKFNANDSKSNITARQQRGYEVENSILEGSIGLELNFVEYNLHKFGLAFTPYLYTGLTYFRYDFNYFDEGELINFDQRDGAMAIPMIVGFKYRISDLFILGAEVGVRYTFTDNLDASNPRNSNVQSFSFGNINSDDWYVFSGLTLTYTFGRKPCMEPCFE